MYLTRIAIVLAVLTTFCLGVKAMPAADEKTVTVAAKDTEGKVDLAKGDKLLLKLSANPTTGFTWVIASKDSDKLKTDGKPAYEAAKKGAIGGGGTQTFTFEAAAAGEVEVELHYKRTFEKDKEPAKKYKLKVTIK
jgi:inhibitor of cysteine peptidase